LSRLQELYLHVLQLLQEVHEAAAACISTRQLLALTSEGLAGGRQQPQVSTIGIQLCCCQRNEVHLRPVQAALCHCSSSNRGCGGCCSLHSSLTAVSLCPCEGKGRSARAFNMCVLGFCLKHHGAAFPGFWGLPSSS
jgi:hypothetical protein